MILISRLPAFTQAWALFQREITETQAGAVAHQPQAFQLVGSPMAICTG
jgi:hypothetical protein